MEVCDFIFIRPSITSPSYSIVAESSVSQCQHICSICSDSKADITVVGRGQKVDCSMDQTALQGGLVP